MLWMAIGITIKRHDSAPLVITRLIPFLPPTFDDRSFRSWPRSTAGSLTALSWTRCRGAGPSPRSHSQSWSNRSWYGGELELLEVGLQEKLVGGGEADRWTADPA